MPMITAMHVYPFIRRWFGLSLRIIYKTNRCTKTVKIIAISAGQAHSLGLLEGGSVLTWGDNNGQTLFL